MTVLDEVGIHIFRPVIGGAPRPWYVSRKVGIGVFNGHVRASSDSMKCDERAGLLNAYNGAALAISITVEDLLNSAGVVSSAIYDLRRHAAEKARIQFEFARLAYEVHVREHRCEATYLSQLYCVGS